MSRLGSTGRVFAEVTLAAVAAGSVYLVVRERENCRAAAQRSAEQAAALSAAREEAARLARELDQVKNSDRYAYEALQELVARQGDLLAVQEAQEQFLKTYPQSPYRQQVTADLATTKNLIVAIRKKIDQALSDAAKAKDALEAFEILSAFSDAPVRDQRMAEWLDKYRPEADRLRAAREARKTLGVEFENLRSSYEIKGQIGDRLWLPLVRADVRNTSDRPITQLKVSAQFVDRGNNRLFGDKVTEHVVSPFGGSDSLPPAWRRPCSCTGTSASCPTSYSSRATARRFLSTLR